MIPIRHRISEFVQAGVNRDALAPVLLAPGRQPLSYGRLLELMRGIGEQLAEIGADRASRIATALPVGPQAATVFLTISPSVTCAPLNPNFTVTEFRHHLARLACDALVVPVKGAVAARQAAAELALPLLEIEEQAEGEAGWFSFAMRKGLLTGKKRMHPPSSEDCPALLLHTSGSTATPKLVPITERSICHSSCATAESLELTFADRFLHMLPLFHVHGLVSGLLVPLAAGGSIVITSGLVAERFCRWLQEFQPTWYSAAPAMHHLILEQLRMSPRALGKTSLRFIRSGSSALAPALMEELQRLLAVPMIEAYGMTEVPHISGNPFRNRKTKSVGRSVAPEIAIMADDGQLLPSGQVGEVVVRGPTVTRGYLEDPEGNAAAFAGGWFHTGDQGWLDQDGYLFLTGRLKEMINRGGEKISPYELEDVLREHSAVAEAAVFAIPDERFGEEVGAAVTLRNGGATTEEDLRRFLRERLTWSKVPRRIVIVEAIPKAATGKTQRVGLAARLGLQESAPAALVAESKSSSTQSALLRLWGELLGVQDLSVQDNFFELGGHSLLAMRLLSRVHRQFGVEVPMRTLFDSPTVAQLAEAIEKQLKHSSKAGPPKIQRVSRHPNAA